MPIVECVPNFSEGRREEVIAAILAAAEAVHGVAVLDVHRDPAHNRSVLTLVGEADAMVEAAFRCAQTAAGLIDMATHRGEHPRMGATDVIPCVPLGDTPMTACVDLAHRLGRRIGDDLEIPVYLYAEAATRPERRRLPDVRRPQFEGLQRLVGSDPVVSPDFGPPRLGSAGATAVGARPFLIAFNVNLASEDLSIARAIARAIRESSGGMRGVQALGMRTPDPSVVQVSTNLLDLDATPLLALFEAIQREAAARGAKVLGSELVGLIPTAALAATARQALALPTLSATQAVEALALQVMLERRD